MAVRRSKGVVFDVVSPEQVEALATLVLANRAVLRKKALTIALSPRGEFMLRDALAQRDLETTKKYFRVALPVQVKALLASGATVPVAQLRTALAGLESASEAKALIAELVRTRAARLVLGAGKPALARPELSVATAATISEIQRAAEALLKQLKAAKGAMKKSPPAGLGTEDLRVAVQALVGALEQRPAGLDLVLSKMSELSTPEEPLVFLPAVIHALKGTLSPEQVTGHLLEASRAGQLELRPESGLQLLSEGDAALCPRSPSGAPLSYIRRLDVRN